MTVLEEALLEENESLTQMIESERSEHESQKKALIEKYEKEITSLQQDKTNLIDRMQHLMNDCVNKIHESSQAQKERYEKSLESLRKKLISLQEELQNLRVKYDAWQMNYEKLKKDVENL